MSEQGYIILDFDYLRPLKITREFYDELEKYELGGLLNVFPAIRPLVTNTLDGCSLIKLKNT